MHWLCFLMLALVMGVHGQWAPTSGPRNKAVLGLASLGNNLFAATGEAGVFRSQNGGANWQQMNAGLFNAFDTNTLCITVKERNVFLGTKVGVFRSGDTGRSWIKFSQGLSDNYVQALAAMEGALWVGTPSRGVFRSRNDGISWEPMNAGLWEAGMADTNVLAFASMGSNLFAGTRNGGVFRSTDTGKSWHSVTTGLTQKSVSALGVSDSLLLAGTVSAGARDAGIFRSLRGDGNWLDVKADLNALYVAAFAAAGKSVFAGTDAGVYASADNGITWVQANAGLALPVYCFAVVGVTLFAGTSDGVWRRPLSEISAIRFQAAGKSIRFRQSPAHFFPRVDFRNPQGHLTLLGRAVGPAPAAGIYFRPLVPVF